MTGNKTKVFLGIAALSLASMASAESVTQIIAEAKAIPTTTAEESAAKVLEQPVESAPTDSEASNLESPDFVSNEEKLKLLATPELSAPNYKVVLPPVAPDRETRFQGAIQEKVPVTPEEVKKAKALYDDLQKAKFDRNVVPQTRSITVSLENGHEIPYVLVVRGPRSSIAFSDKYGNPWPITDVGIGGDAGGYDAEFPQTTKNKNVIRVNAIRDYGAGNISLLLHGLDVPVPIEIRNDTTRYDARLDIRIDAVGPLSQNIQVTSSVVPSTTSADLNKILDNVPPAGFMEIGSSSDRVRAWSTGDWLYIRTTQPLLAPNYQEISHSLAGVKAYRLQKTPVLLMSANGRTEMVKLDLTGASAFSSARQEADMARAFEDEFGEDEDIKIHDESINGRD